MNAPYEIIVTPGDRYGYWDLRIVDIYGQDLVESWDYIGNRKGAIRSAKQRAEHIAQPEYREVIG